MCEFVLILRVRGRTLVVGSPHLGLPLGDLGRIPDPAVVVATLGVAQEAGG